MKKLIIALSLAAVSHFNVYAQLTQDAVIAMCPELPSEQDMIDWAWRPGLQKIINLTMKNSMKL